MSRLHLPLLRWTKPLLVWVKTVRLTLRCTWCNPARTSLSKSWALQWLSSFELPWSAHHVPVALTIRQAQVDACLHTHASAPHDDHAQALDAHRHVSFVEGRCLHSDVPLVNAIAISSPQCLMCDGSSFDVVLRSRKMDDFGERVLIVVAAAPQLARCIPLVATSVGEHGSQQQCALLLVDYVNIISDQMDARGRRD